ncbi:MAG: nucleoside deaminase [Acholeplasmatales bacterium]|nr:nucleoside deaminase [Acholeplasmatales bacterium]
MNKFMMIAYEMAKQNLLTDHCGPFGAVVVKSGTVVGVGHNQVVETNDPTAHAEIQAIRDACKNLNTFDLSGCVLYTSCYPCPMCLSAIIWANITDVYYGNTKEDAADIGFRDDKIYVYLEHLSKNMIDPTLLLTPIDREETMKAFNEFKNKTENKTMY